MPASPEPSAKPSIIDRLCTIRRKVSTYSSAVPSQYSRYANDYHFDNSIEKREWMVMKFEKQDHAVATIEDLYLSRQGPRAEHVEIFV